MTGAVRSRRASVPLDRPLYARVLRLRHLAPSGFLCFVYLEGAFALGILLALAELVSWWGVLVLPAVVALMVKLNDVVAGLLARPAGRATRDGRARQTGRNTRAALDSQTPRAGRRSQIGRTVAVRGAADGKRVGPETAGGAAALRGAADGERVGRETARGAAALQGAAGGERAGREAAAPVGGAAEDERFGVEPRVGPGDRVSGPAGAPGSAAGVDDASAWRPAVGRATPSAPASVPPEVIEAGPPTSHAWADQLDVREQMARQSAARRYE